MLHSILFLVRKLLPLFILFIIWQMGLRIALLLLEHHNITFEAAPLAQLFGIGLIYDTVAWMWVMLPLVLLLMLGGKKWYKPRFFKGIYALFLYILIFTSVAEWLFWDEFQSRFNFIAVDYLVYTHEVIGNIRESYPLPLLLAIIAALTFLLFIATHRWVMETTVIPTAPLAKRISTLSLYVAAVAVSFCVLSDRLAESSANHFHNEISKNGFYSLFSAFRNNSLDYQRFYIATPERQALEQLRSLPPKKRFVSKDIDDLSHISRPWKQKRDYNVMIVVMESMSANFMERFGNKGHITPNLDKLAKESIFFTQLYATGTRTVRGLEALTLSIPPVPGSSIIKHQNNANLSSLGFIMRKRGYDTKFIYGGFGYFDNMNHFFKENGFDTVDRSSLASNEISFANIWGVCDEDLFKRAIKEADRSYDEHKPFLQLVMTTSNHRPYTFPENKIDLPSHNGRAGGVKYADFAVGELLKEAKTKPWFRNTLFVFVADHTAGGAGKIELALEKYHIPAMIYAPHLLSPQEISTLSSQIDIPTTLLGLLGGKYVSKFYGQDLLAGATPRAFISTYQKLGYVKDGILTVLKPVKQASYYPLGTSKEPSLSQKELLLQEAISYFQTASDWRKLYTEIQP